MLHDKITAADRLDSVEIAAVWPASAQIAPVPIPDFEPGQTRDTLAPAQTASDVPGEIGAMMLSACMALLAAFAIAPVLMLLTVIAMGIAIATTL